MTTQTPPLTQGFLFITFQFSQELNLRGSLLEHMDLQWYLGKLMATGNIFLGIDSSGGIDSAIELIPRRNRFPLCENF